MRWWKATGFGAPARSGDLLYFLVPFAPVMTNLIPGLEVASLRHLFEVCVITLMVWFADEVIFRGLMLNALKARGLWKAAIVTALLFGLTHALNGLAGRSLVEVMAQVFYALAIGFAYAALVLHKGLLWPLVQSSFLDNSGQRPAPAMRSLASGPRHVTLRARADLPAFR